MRDTAIDQSYSDQEQFEREIAYVYGVPYPDRVLEKFITALGCHSAQDDTALKNKVISLLASAYEEVRLQNKMDFDTFLAATYEYDLIDLQARQAPTQDIVDTMVKIYRTVFGRDHSDIETASRLRTFLYQHKIYLQSLDSTLSEGDKDFLRVIDQKSKAVLKRLRGQSA